jgi:hypothetical protein
MKVFVYPDGAHERGQTFTLPPVEGALAFAEKACGIRSARLIVTPKDEEAVALGGWAEDEDGPYRAFDLTPDVKITWSIEEDA